MKLKELKTEYHIFCDIDGVLSNFGKHVEEVLGIKDDANFRQQTPTLHKIFWEKMVDYDDKGGRFWEELSLMDDAMELWDYIKGYKPTIITATGRGIPNAKEQKHNWLKKHFPGVPYIITSEPGEKGNKHGKENRILIDDRDLELIPWEKNGGIGVLHTNTKNTIKQLKKLGL